MTETAAVPARRNPWLWLLPVFGGVLGGMVALAFTYEEDRRSAYAMLLLGLAVTAAFILLVHTYGLPGDDFAF